jgi:hypothetical protein
MVKRLISANASEVAKFTKEDLKQSIKASEGRVVLSENVVLQEPIIGDITSSELAKAFGADLILLNVFDVYNPIILGMPGQSHLANAKPNENVVRELKELIGLPVGLNLEPIDPNAEMAEDQTSIATGRQASAETLKKASQLGFDFVLLTGNPGTGVTNKEIAQAVSLAKEHFDGVIIAGKMHGAGVNEPVVNLEAAKEFIERGADILLVPAVGTVWGVREEEVRKAIDLAHETDALVMSAIGTSQESSDPDIIKQIALHNKTLGVDIQHIGDANMGLVGIRNITVLSDAIRGARHTVARIARSVKR